MPQADRWMIYGAYGFTGSWIAREAVRRGLRPILAGRNASQLAPLADELNTEYRTFSLDEPNVVREALQDCRLVLNCAGPFSQTAQPMVMACLETGTTYLDITGEVDVLEWIAQLHESATRRNVTLIPGLGFDVVPTDTLAVLLKEALPSANLLQLALTGTGSLSIGTTRTIIEACQKGGRIRRNGQIVSVPLGWKKRRVPFRPRRLWAMTVPWGDVATAWYSTGIPNIEVYLAMPIWAIIAVRLFFPRRVSARGWPYLRYLEPLLRRIFGTSPPGKTAQKVDLWGCVSNDQGNTKTATMQTPDGYQLTVETTLAAVSAMLDQEYPGGFFTPTQAFGINFALQIDGVDFRFEDDTQR
ncbi:MAG: saccharopine dehydrogenase NADP-binding domain-containing protein [Thermogutta sp.]